MNVLMIISGVMPGPAHPTMQGALSQVGAKLANFIKMTLCYRYDFGWLYFIEILANDS